MTTTSLSRRPQGRPTHKKTNGFIRTPGTMTAGPCTSITFLNLPEGAEFTWVVPPKRNGFELNSKFVKGGPRMFGPVGCVKMFDVAERELEYLVRAL